MGEPLPRPSLEEVDNVCKTYKDTAVMGHDCINPKAILQLPVESASTLHRPAHSVRGKACQSVSWSHMKVLRPKPSGGYRTIGLTVAPLRALSRLRRPLAQKWENAYFWGCQGKACDRAAWAHSIMVAAAKERAAVGGFFVTWTWPKIYERVGHDRLCEKRLDNKFPKATLGLLVRFRRRLAVSRGRQVCYFSLLGLWGPFFRLQWRHHHSLSCGCNVGFQGLRTDRSRAKYAS